MGYLSSKADASNYKEYKYKLYSEAVRKYQEFYGLKVTGKWLASSQKCTQSGVLAKTMLWEKDPHFVGDVAFRNVGINLQEKFCSNVQEKFCFCNEFAGNILQSALNLATPCIHVICTYVNSTSENCNCNFIVVKSQQVKSLKKRLISCLKTVVLCLISRRMISSLL